MGCLSPSQSLKANARQGVPGNGSFFVYAVWPGVVSISGERG